MSAKTVAIWLGIFVLAAMALRIGGNVGASYDEETGRYLYSGNDPYYHDRTVDHIVDTGESLLWDDAINYPEGGPNPNPPLFDWTTALDAKILDSFGVEDATGLALNVSVAFWGAITVIPVFLIGAELFGRKAGLWAGFFMAVSAPHIQRGLFGFADHDATTMFWITLAMFFLVKGVKALDDREYVKDWRHKNALAGGLRNSFQHNQQAMLWGALAGTALTATALTWKGYPYVLAVMAVAVGLQLLSDHLKNKDSTALWAFYLLPLVMVTVLPLVYYAAFPSFLDTTIWAGAYVLLGVLIVGAILVPTRDLPSILVFPALALAGLIGLLLMTLVFPDVGQTVFTGLGYFEQTKLYTTIAEAQRTELGNVAASFGFFAFLVAFIGLYHTAKKAWKGDASMTLMFSWAAVALFMAFAASRFVMNAAPVFAVLAGSQLPRFTSWLKLDEMRRRFRQQHGQNQFKAGMRSLNMRVVGGSLLIFALFVFPNAWLGVDAALPCEVDHCNPSDEKHIDQLGAFGIDFDVKANGWLGVMNDLAALDQGQRFEDRPAFIAWWDYGHWATSIGEHPTVADPFQNHYNIAGRFLASESEQAGMAWLTILMINADYHHDGRSAYSPELEAVLSGIDANLLEIGPMRGYDDEFAVFGDAVDLSGDEVFTVYDDVSEATGKAIGYFGVDRRMYPFSADASGIFYAPAFLANKDPDDFLSYRYQGTGLTLDVQQYAVDENGDSYRLAEPTIKDASGRDYVVVPTGAGSYEAYPAKTYSSGAPGTPVQFSLNPTQRFYDSMYAQAFGSNQNGFVPGDGMTHWRVISEGEGHAVELLEYFRGVTVTGVVKDDAGQRLEGVKVSFVDGYGARHDVATTDSEGEYTVLAPFAMDGDLTLEARDGVILLANTTLGVQFTRDQARFGHVQNGVDLTVERGSVSGLAYRDDDGDSVYTPGNDTVLADATVTLEGATMQTGADGRFAFDGVRPGILDLAIALDGYTDATRSIELAPGAAQDREVALAPAPSDVTFTLVEGGEPLAQIPFTVTRPDDDTFSRPLTTDADGTVATTLAPGTYAVDLSYQVMQDGETVTYKANWSGVVPFGGAPRDFEIVVTTN